jgi:hypothetical protein
MHELPDFDELARESKVYAAYRREREARGDGACDLVPLWHAAGRPRKWPGSPRRWYAPRRQYHDLVQDGPGRGADAPLVLDSTAALGYAQALCPLIMGATIAVMEAKFHADPAGTLMGCPTPLVAFFAKAAQADNTGVTTHAEADRGLLDEVVSRTAALGPWEQESAVARVQRALRGEAALPGAD